MNHFVVHYGLPKRIHTDQGRNFESALIREMCAVLGLKKSHTTPYHAMGNGMTEKFNQTLINMLKTLDRQEKRNWKAHVAPLVHAYNASRHASTKYAPFVLMFGRQPRLPIDLLLNSPGESQEQSHSKYVETLKRNLQNAYRVASAEADRARLKQKETYDTRARCGTIEVGERVLVKILAHDGKHKLADRWELVPYLVCDQPNEDIPVFVVKKENGEGSARTLHRNHLLPISTLPLCEVFEQGGKVLEKGEKGLGKVEKGLESEEKKLHKEDGQEIGSQAMDGTSTSESQEEDGFFLFLDGADEVTTGGSTDAGASLAGEGERDRDRAVSLRDSDEGIDRSLGDNSDVDGGSELSSLDGECGSKNVVSDIESVSTTEDEEPVETAEEEKEDEAEQVADVVEETAARLPPKVRRSKRDRRKPDRLQAGNYATQLQQMPQGGWEKRAEFLANLAMTDTFSHIPDRFCQAILKIVEESCP